LRLLSLPKLEVPAAGEQSERPSTAGLSLLPPSPLAEMLPRVGLVKRESPAPRPGLFCLVDEGRPSEFGGERPRMACGGADTC
jgi:hypothetical protein